MDIILEATGHDFTNIYYFLSYMYIDTTTSVTTIIKMLVLNFYNLIKKQLLFMIMQPGFD